MQIAKVVPKVRTKNDQIFDYSIPPQILPLIKIGVLVLVPFSNRKIEGIVIDIKRSSTVGNLKPIISVIDSTPVIDQIHTELAKWLSDYYLEPFSKTLFENIVPPAKRILKKGPSYQLPEKNFKTKISPKKFLLIGDFSARLRIYLQAIKKTLAAGKQIIIIVPDLDLVKFFPLSKLAQKNQISFLHAGLKPTERWLQWNNIRSGKTKIVIGSNSAIFAPAKNLGLIVVDQEENETYKNYQSPRFHVLETAEKLGELSNAHLFVGSICPRVETFFEFKNIINLEKKLKSDITNVDISNQKSFISESLQNAIQKSLKNNEKILLVANQKGEGTKIKCLDCNWVYNCPGCSLPLHPFENYFYCPRCEKKYEKITQCPKCQSLNLKAVGLSTGQIKKVIATLFPDKKISIIEKNSTFDPNWDIAIATSYALKFPLPKLGLVGLVDADYALNLPDFHAFEANFRQNFKFLRLAKQGIIQTKLPSHYAITALSQLDYQKFIKLELEERKKFNNPPFGRIIKLFISDSTAEKCQKQAEFMAKKLGDFKDFEIFGPSPAFVEKKRNIFTWQIILKFPKLTSHEKTFLKNLPSGWKIDVDPIRFL